MDQFLKPFVFEDLEPFEIGERCGVGRRRIIAAAAKNIRRMDQGPPIVGTHLASQYQDGRQRNKHASVFHRFCSVAFPGSGFRSLAAEHSFPACCGQSFHDIEPQFNYSARSLRLVAPLRPRELPNLT